MLYEVITTTGIGTGPLDGADEPASGEWPGRSHRCRGYRYQPETREQTRQAEKRATSTVVIVSKCLIVMRRLRSSTFATLPGAKKSSTGVSRSVV